MPNNSQIDAKRVIKIPQQYRRDPLPNQSVETRHLSLAAKKAMWRTAAVVGTALDVTNGKATHSTLAQALLDTTTGDKIIFLAQTNTETIILNDRRFFEGMGYDTQFTGTWTLNSSADFCIFKYMRFTNTVTINAGADGNIFSDGFIATTATIVDGGAGTIIDMVALA